MSRRHRRPTVGAFASLLLLLAVAIASVSGSARYGDGGGRDDPRSSFLFRDRDGRPAPNGGELRRPSEELEDRRPPREFDSSPSKIDGFRGAGDGDGITGGRRRQDEASRLNEFAFEKDGFVSASKPIGNEGRSNRGDGPNDRPLFLRAFEDERRELDDGKSTATTHQLGNAREQRDSGFFSRSGTSSGARLVVRPGPSLASSPEELGGSPSSRDANSSTSNFGGGVLPRAALQARHAGGYGTYGTGYHGYDRYYGEVADPYYSPHGRDLLGHYSHNSLYDGYGYGDHNPSLYYYGRYYSHDPAYSWAGNYGNCGRSIYGCGNRYPWNNYYSEGLKRQYHYGRYYDLYKYARRFYPEYTAYKLRGRDALLRCDFPGANIIGDVTWYPPGRYGDNYGRYRSYSSRDSAIMEIHDYGRHDFGAYRCYAKIRRHYSGYHTEYVYQDLYFYPWSGQHYGHHDGYSNYDDYYDYKLPYGRNRYQERYLYD